MEIGRGLFKCNIDLQAGEISKENFNGRIPSVARKCDRGVLSGHTTWKLGMYLG